MQTAVSLSPWLLGGVVVAIWVVQQPVRPAPVQGLAVFLWLLAGVPVLRALRRASSGVLRWDGQQWSWESGTSRLVGCANRRLDWQGAILLEFCPVDGGTLWLWPERRMDPLRWSDLRRALQASLAADAHLMGDRVQP